MIQRLNLRHGPRHVKDDTKRENINENLKSYKEQSKQIKNNKQRNNRKKFQDLIRELRLEIDKVKHIIGKNQEQRLIPRHSLVKLCFLKMQGIVSNQCKHAHMYIHTYLLLETNQIGLCKNKYRSIVGGVSIELLEER